MRITYLMILGFGLLTVACSNADTLGDEPPVEVTITGEPTYANGVGELLDLKCGYCHAIPLPPTAPNNIVQDLDLTTYATRIQGNQVIRGADAIGRFIKDGLFEHDVNLYTDSRVSPVDPIDVRRMPLDYGTQLTTGEKNALKHWAEAGLPENSNVPNPSGDASAGAEDWGYCNYCHGLDADGLEHSSGRWLGPKLDEEAVTIAKIRSMWLWSQATFPELPQPISDQRAANLRSYIFSIDKQATPKSEP